jgi:hypothetical protein
MGGGGHHIRLIFAERIGSKSLAAELQPSFKPATIHARMPTRLAKVSELNLLLALRHRTWGARKDAFKSWSIGDEISFIVGKNLAARAVVSGPSRQSDERIWPDDIYPYRLPISFNTFFLPGDRPLLFGDVRDALMSIYGAKWGFAMINQTAIPERAEIAIRSVFDATRNQLQEAEGHLDGLIAQARVGHDIEQHRPRVDPTPVPAESPQEPAESPQEESLHTRAQGALIELGRAARCSIWVASNDRGKLFKGSRLGDHSLKALPSIGLSSEAMNRIALIDVLWFQHNAPAFAFEVEVTTSVYSGLLRMSDLLALVPALKMNLFIVAPATRRAKVMAELARPTFQKIGLSDYCRFIALEALEALIDKLDAFRGYVHPGIIETLAEDLEDDITEERA